MSLRASSLQATNTLSINREIDSKYDAVLAVKEKLPEIEIVAGMDIDALIAALEEAQDFTGITVVSGAETSWDPITKVLTVESVKGDTGATGPAGPQGIRGLQGVQGPRGLTGAAGINGTNGINGANGIDGLNGMVPILQFNLDVDGDLSYEVIGYEEGPTLGERFPVEEW